MTGPSQKESYQKLKGLHSDRYVAETCAALEAENAAKDARIEALVTALLRAAEVLECLAENQPDCRGWEPPFPSTTPSIAVEAKAARAALSGDSGHVG